jgi:hypothetical protein
MIFATSRLIAGVTWLYVSMVIATLLCPIHCCTSLGFAPRRDRALRKCVEGRECGCLGG